jgi:lauroyl/myristoyl acyltransferase
MREGDAQVARRLGAASMREVFKVLRSGGVVAMALDRDLIGNGEPLEFFGKPAPIPIGSVEIAIRAGAAIVPILLFRDRYRVKAVVHPEIRYAADAPRDAEVRKTAQMLLRIFEKAIREHPEQWHVLDPIWPAAGTQ